MKFRIAKKQIKKNVYEKLFSNLEKFLNVKITNKNFEISRSELNDFSLSSFKIKECPEWRFGIWFMNKELTLYGEHNLLIDKFKPTRTSFFIDIKNEKDFLTAISKMKHIIKNGYIDDEMKNNVLSIKQKNILMTKIDSCNFAYINNKISELNERENVNYTYKLKRTKKNYKNSCDYYIELFTEKDDDLVDGDLVEKDYFEISKDYPYSLEEFKNYSYSVSEFYFDYFNEVNVINKDCFCYKKEIYNWDENDLYENIIKERRN